MTPTNRERSYGMYGQTVLNSKLAGETNDCSVRALSMVMRISYNAARLVMEEMGRKSRTGAGIDMIVTALHAKGYNMYAVEPDLRKLVKSEMSATRILSGVHGAFLIFTRSHVIGYCDGVTNDASSFEPKKARVKSMFRIAKMGEE